MHRDRIYLNRLASYKLFVIDEWLINDLTQDDIQFLFELFEIRYDNLQLFLLVSIKQLTGIHVSVVVYMQMLLWIVLYIILLLLNLVMLI